MKIKKNFNSPYRVMYFPSGWCLHGVLHHLSRVWWINHHFLQYSNCCLSRRLQVLILRWLLSYKGLLPQKGTERQFWRRNGSECHHFDPRYCGVCHWYLGCRVSLFDETLHMLLWQSTTTGESFKSDLLIILIIYNLRRTILLRKITKQQTNITNKLDSIEILNTLIMLYQIIYFFRTSILCIYLYVETFFPDSIFNNDHR